jgi:hypothetical protein
LGWTAESRGAESRLNMLRHQPWTAVHAARFAGVADMASLICVAVQNALPVVAPDGRVGAGKRPFRIHDLNVGRVIENAAHTSVILTIAGSLSIGVEFRIVDYLLKGVSNFPVM